MVEYLQSYFSLKVGSFGTPCIFILTSILHCEHKKQLHLHVLKKLAASKVVVELSLIKCTENGKSGHGRGARTK